jgi:hypothetical protein
MEDFMYEVTRRRVEIFVDGQWTLLENELADLKVGDLFRMFEDTGERVTDSNGQYEFLVATDSYFDAELGEHVAVYE